MRSFSSKSEQKLIRRRTGGNVPDTKRTCEYTDGVCTHHGVKGRRRWRPTGRKTRVVGPDGRVSLKSEREIWYECDVGPDGKTRTQSRLSFAPRLNTMEDDPINSSNVSTFVKTRSVGQGDELHKRAGFKTDARTKNDI